MDPEVNEKKQLLDTFSNNNPPAASELTNSGQNQERKDPYQGLPRWVKRIGEPPMR